MFRRHRPKLPKFEVTEAVREAAASLRTLIERSAPEGVTSLALRVEESTVIDAGWRPERIDLSTITLSETHQQAAYVLVANVAIHARAVADALNAVASLTEQEAQRLGRASALARDRQLAELGVIVAASHTRGMFDGAVVIKRRK